MENGLDKMSITISVRDSDGLDQDQNGEKQIGLGCV